MIAPKIIPSGNAIHVSRHYFTQPRLFTYEVCLVSQQFVLEGIWGCLSPMFANHARTPRQKPRKEKSFILGLQLSHRAVPQLRGLPSMTSALEGGRGVVKKWTRVLISCVILYVTRRGGVKKYEIVMDVIDGSPLRTIVQCPSDNMTVWCWQKCHKNIFLHLMMVSSIWRFIWGFQKLSCLFVYQRFI